MTELTKVDGLVEKYIKLREFKDATKKDLSEKLAKIEAHMDEIEVQLMTFLNNTGQESANTKAGTFFKRTTTSAKVADRDMFMKFVQDNDAFNFLESRCNKTAVDEYITEHNTVPPGVSVVRDVAISVNRPKARG